jgi:hypothetical protein
MRVLLVLLGGLFFCLPSFAADGDSCPVGLQIDSANTNRRVWRNCRMLCDAHVEADDAWCDMEIIPHGTNAFQFVTATSCTGAPTITIGHRFPGTTTFADLGVMSAVGDVLIVPTPILGDVRATISDDTGCATTGIRVLHAGMK